MSDNRQHTGWNGALISNGAPQLGRSEARDRAPSAPSWFEEGRNCWRTEPAARAAFLIDGAAYFSAFRESAKQARHSIIILGWDFDSRVRMLIDQEPDGYPDRLGEFLHSLLIHRRSLRIYVLTWDFHMIYWKEREWWLPSKLAAHRRLHFVRDAVHPVAASHHQKVVVVDDAIAFVGGLDFAQCRWDSPQHRPRHPDRRLCADDAPCRPFHDVQMAVDGAAASALGALARERWRRATGRSLVRIAHPIADSWPASVKPDITNVRVAIARTLPEYIGQSGVREVETLFLDSLAAATRYVYIETQYLTCRTIAEVLANRLQEPRGPEIVMILHPNSDGWLEQHTMDVLRGRVLARLRNVDRFHRLRLYYPHIPDLEDQCISMHSKVCIIDNELVRVGSANLSNRSMGLDTECDLAIQAEGQVSVQRQIALFRHRLLAEHLGVELGQIERELEKDGSLIGTIERLRSSGRSLETFDVRIAADIDEVVPDADFIDPSRPYEAQFIPPEQRRPARRQLITGALALFALIVLAALWQWTPAREYLDVLVMAAQLEEFARGPMAPFATVAGFVVGGFLVMPVLLLIAVTIVAFGPWWGFLYAFIGMTVSAMATFWIGRLLGRHLIDRLSGSRLYHVSQTLASKGVLAVVTIRILPLAPFSIVNAVAGASHIKTRDFLLGTMIGEFPGLLSLALFVDQIQETIRHPGPGSLGFLALLAALVVAVLWGIRRWLRTHPDDGARR
jgi:phospholipase D1/2